MLLLLLATLCASATCFVGVGAVTNQFGTSRRRFIQRAERLATRSVASDEVAVERGALLRPDALAGSERLAGLLRRQDWAIARATMLDRADVPLKVSEWLGCTIALFAGIGLGTWLISSEWWIGLVFGMASLVVFEVWIRNRAARHALRFDAQLPGALDIMATQLRSGFGILESLRTVSRDMEAPIATEFERALDETRIGASFDSALGRMADRVESSDFRIVARAVTIHRSVGGDLAEVLESVAGTLREREELRGHVRALTAEQRLGAGIMGLLPIYVIGFFLLTDADFIRPLWTDSVGRIIGIAALGMNVTGQLIMRRILKVEV